MDERENQQTVQKELKEELLLCDAKGRLNPEAVSWSRRPLPILNVHGNFPFRKGLERWEVHCDAGVLHASALAGDTVSALRAEFIRADSGGAISGGALVRFPESRRLSLGDRWSSPVSVALEGIRMEVRPFAPEVEGEGDERAAGAEKPKRSRTVAGKLRRGIERIKATVAGREAVDRLTLAYSGENGVAVSAEIEAVRPLDQESLNITAAWKRRQFVWLSRTVYPECRGRLTMLDGDIDLGRKGAVALREVVRGVFPLQMSGTRAVCLSRSGREFCGIVAGTDWSRGSGLNENGLLLDGRLYKLFDAVRFLPMEGGRTALRTLSSSAVDLVFEPTHESVVEGRLLLLHLRLVRRYGRFSGEVRVGQKRARIDGAPGSLEEFRYLG